MHLGNIECRVSKLSFKILLAKRFYCLRQPNHFEQEIMNKTGGANRGPSKNLGEPWPTQPPPLELPLHIDATITFSRRCHHEESIQS